MLFSITTYEHLKCVFRIITSNIKDNYVTLKTAFFMSDKNYSLLFLFTLFISLKFLQGRKRLNSKALLLCC